MIFEISRASLYGDEKPCEEAFETEVPDWEVRTCSEEEYNRMFAEQEGLWREKGTNHQVIRNGYIMRQNGMKKSWGIVVNTLNHFVMLTEKYGPLIFDGSKIIIYDSYIE